MNIERIESEPRRSQEYRDCEADLEQDNRNSEYYTALLNAACHTIRSVPPELLDNPFISQVLDTLSAKALQAGNDKACDELDHCNMEIMK
jgi:hypothetical protein